MNLKSLKAALRPLAKFAQDELTFMLPLEDGGEVGITLRPLLPKEEIECQRRAKAILDQAISEEGTEPEEGLSRATSLQYFDCFRIEVISHSLVSVGNSDFRGVTLIETEEVLPSGATVKVPLTKAIRDLISETWSRSMISICFSKYGDLVAKLAAKSDRVVAGSNKDLDAEVQRLEDRLKALKQEKENRAKGDPSVSLDQVKMIMVIGEALQKEIDVALDEAQFAKEAEQEGLLARDMSLDRGEDETPPVEPKRRTSVIPPEVPPPTQREQAPPVTPTLVGTTTGKDGESVEVYRLPSETLSNRGTQTPPEKAPRTGNLNPNFRPLNRGR